MTSFNLADLSLALSPADRQRIAANAVRGAPQGDEQAALAQAFQSSRQLDPLAAVAPLLNNPGLTKAAQSAQTSLQGLAPQKLGVSGQLIPQTGQFVTNPVFKQEREDQRAARAQLAQDRLQGQRERQSQTDLLRQQGAQLRAQNAAGIQAFRDQSLQLRRQAEERLKQQGDARIADAENARINNGVFKLKAVIDKSQLPAMIPQARRILEQIELHGEDNVPGLSAREVALSTAGLQSLLSEDAVKNITAYQGVIAAMRRKNAGLAQTVQETANVAKETFDRLTSTSRTRAIVFRDKIAKELETARVSALGSGSNAVRKRYRQNQLATGSDISWMDPLASGDIGNAALIPRESVPQASAPQSSDIEILDIQDDR